MENFGEGLQVDVQFAVVQADGLDQALLGVAVMGDESRGRRREMDTDRQCRESESD